MSETSMIWLSDLTAQNLDKKDLFSESDPFYCLYRTNEDDSRTLVYRSEWIKVGGNIVKLLICIYSLQNNACPDWSPVTLDCAKLCLGDWARPLRLEVFDWDLDGGHDFIGACVTNLETLVQGEEFQIVQVYHFIINYLLMFMHYNFSLIS